MEKKIGVYICTGCGIGESLDIDKLSEIATGEYNVPLCKTHPFLCGKEGIQVIKDDIEKEGVNAVVIMGCSPRVNYDVFKFPNVVVERGNIREQVVWSHPANDEDTQMMAEDYTRMTIVKTEKCELPEPHKEDISKDILVIGGGISGITAALEAANAGYKVVLVEKEKELGGFAAKCFKQLPTKDPYQELEEPIIATKINEVKANDNVKIYTGATVEKIEGAPGLFDVTIKSNGSSSTEKIGAIVLATGWKPYDASKLEKLGYGSPNVITNVEMEELAAKGKIVRPSDGKEVKSIAFIQCAGQRDEEHLPYCSGVCCLVSLKQAKYLRAQDPDAKAFIFYKDMRTLGLYENFYKTCQDDEGIFLTKGEVVSVNADEGGATVVVEDTLIGEKIEVNVDLVVLATGMVPSTKDEAILNLEYRQGPGLPELELFYGYADSNFICFPYETRRTGIYAAGAVRQPLNIAACMEDATGAALKAIQCVEMTSRGEAVHPRAGDISFADFFMQRCTQCKRCTEECPFGAINEDEQANPLYNPTRCRRCAVCMGACPERIISFKNYSVDMIGSMIKAIEVPDEYEEKPRILVLACENDAYPAIDMAGINRMEYSAYVRVIPLRCLGSTNIIWIADALSKGIDGILLLGCKYGDDYQCHFIKGSELANYRMEKVQETLDRLVLESERVRLLEIAITDYDKIPGIINEFLEKIEELGPNPYKGF
ncbi:MAG: heterodisulfide reductase subunit A [Deltaproteobacteria bacterium]|nr:MAG: heterodisulfide reductase subunit A [Deltaproteobacteria bacterium]